MAKIKRLIRILSKKSGGIGSIPFLLNVAHGCSLFTPYATSFWKKHILPIATAEITKIDQFLRG